MTVAIDPIPGSADPLNIEGVLPPVVTPFDESGDLDRDRTATHVRFLLEGGVHGLVTLGTNGEFPLLSGRERDSLVEIVVDEVDGDVPVLAGVGTPGTHETVERAERAAEAGADGLVVVTPYYFPVEDDALASHYRRVADAVACPIYAYNIPKRTGNAITEETLEELASIDGVAGVKDSSEDVGWLARASETHPDLTFLAGSDDLLVDSLLQGCSALVSAVATVFPGPVVDLFEAYDDGNAAVALERQRTIQEIKAALEGETLVPGVKAALSLRGFDVGSPRDPLPELDGRERDALAARLEELHQTDTLENLDSSPET